jgi:hypothetical protein
MKDETLETKMRAFVGHTETIYMPGRGPDGLEVIPYGAALRIAREHAEARARPLREALERVVEDGPVCDERCTNENCRYANARAALAAEQAHAEARREPRDEQEQHA